MSDVETLWNEIRWPLISNGIRRGDIQNTFGANIRKKKGGGTKPHQGWDLYALPGTNTYAIADGTIVRAGNDHKKYGNIIVLEFKRRDETLYAAYCHLHSINVEEGDSVSIGQVIGKTGNTGNAASMRGLDQHLHFEIRKIPRTSTGVSQHMDPKDIYGFIPLTTPEWDGSFIQWSNFERPYEIFPR